MDYVNTPTVPPYGACLLGSFNLTRYLYKDLVGYAFDMHQFRKDIPVVVRAMDNVIDRAIYPLEQQKEEAQMKRRMGLGLTGVANALEAVGYPYASDGFLRTLGVILRELRDGAYKASIELAKEKGPFPLFDVALLDSGFAQTLPEQIRDDIEKYGLRNSHLLSIAPTGTISLTADNISSGIEPVFSYGYDRTVIKESGPVVEPITDYGYRVFGVEGRKADDVSPSEHVAVLNLASKYVDSACSKTCNVGADVTWAEFKQIYLDAYDGGASGCTTFRAAGKRYGVLVANKDEEVVEEKPEDKDQLISEEQPVACYFDPQTGQKSCS